MTNRRQRLPGLGVDAERVVNQVTDDLDARLRKLERKPGRAGMVTSDTAAKAGEFLNVEASAAGLTIIFPEPVPSLRDARITLCFRNANPVRLVAIRGQVNRSSFVTNTAVGTFEAVCDGLDGWSVETGLSSTGSATDAQYLLGSAHGSLPSGRVATDSSEIDVDLTVANVASWVLRTASVVLGKLADLTGLSVLGRAANSSGVMAAITATSARQTLTCNDAGTALAWGYPVEVRDSGADQGDAYALDFVAGTNINLAVSVAGGVATITPSVDLSSVTYTAGDGLDLVGQQFSADVSDFAGAGLEDDGSNNLRIVDVDSASIRHTLRSDGSGGVLWGYPIAVRANTGTAIDSVQLDFVDGTHTTAGFAPSANGNAFISYDLNVASLLAAIDSTSVVVGSSTLQRAALTGAIEASQNSNSTVFGASAAGAGLTGDGTATLAVGAGDGIDVSANAVAVDVSDFAGVGLEDDGSNNLRIAAAAAGAGLTGGSGSALAVGAGTHITVNANDVAVDVTTLLAAIDSTSVVVGSGTLQRAAITGDVTIPQNSNTATIANDVVSNAKAANMAANTIKANPTAGAADPQDMSISGNSFPARVGGNLVSHPFSSLVGNALSYNGAGVINVETRTDRHIFIDTTVANSPLAYRKSVQHHYWYEDFDYIDAEGTITTSGGRINFQQSCWGVTAVSASGSIARVAPTSSHPGVVGLTTGNASGNGMVLFNGTSTTPGDDATRADGIQQMEFVYSLSSTSNIGSYVGFMDGTTLQNAILFAYDTAFGHTTVQTRTVEGGTATVKDTGVSPGTGFRLYTMRQETAQTVDFYIDDVLETTHSSSENVPDSETGSLGFFILSRGAATRTMNIDYAMFESVDLGTR